jgi:Rod binding domain-containing protein
MSDLMISGLISARPAAPVGMDADQVKKIKQSTQEFEAVLLRQMLRELRSTAINPNNKSSHSTYLEMADEQMANHLAAQGGMGFGKAMAQQMIQQIQASKLITSSPMTVRP